MTQTFQYTVAATAVLVTTSAMMSAQQISPAEDRQRAHSILAELIEINTTNSERGDTTAAARALERRFLDAGFPAEDVHVVVPDDAATKGNVIARYGGTARPGARPLRDLGPPRGGL